MGRTEMVISECGHFLQFVSRTSANVVHATGGEDRILCRTHIFLILPVTTTLRTLDTFVCGSR